MFAEQSVTVSDAARASSGRDGHTPYDSFLPYRMAFVSSGHSYYADNSHGPHLRDVHFYESGTRSQPYEPHQPYPSYEHQPLYLRHRSHDHKHSHHYRHQHLAHHESSVLEPYRNPNSFHSTSYDGSGPGTTYALGMAHVADKVASHIGTVGDCARGPRLTFGHYGLRLPPVVATKQGELIESTGLFQEVSRADVKPGDYCYRHWTSRVIRAHGGVDEGDAFIVSAVGRRGELYGSNDHHFVVPGDGGRYRDTKFLRPTAEFFRRYGAYA
jgi:hypothetical protein